MKVCDRHPTVPARESFVIPSTQEHFDLCTPCVESLREFISGREPDKPKGKKRDSAKAD